MKSLSLQPDTWAIMNLSAEIKSLENTLKELEGLKAP